MSTHARMCGASRQEGEHADDYFGERFPRRPVSVNGTMPAWAERAEANPLLDFVDSCLRGVGQVCFMNNPVTGLAILVAMFVGEAWLGFAGALGLVVSTATALAHRDGPRRDPGRAVRLQRRARRRRPVAVPAARLGRRW